MLACSCIFAEIINVPDDFETIQDAVDNAADGDSILIATGVYHQSASWTNEPTNLSIIGSNEGNTIIDLEEREDGNIYGIYSQGSDLFAENLILKNIRGMGISCHNGHVEIRNCEFENVWRPIPLQTCPTVVIENCIFSNGWEAIDISGRGGESTIRYNFISDFSRGIKADGLPPYTIINNTIINSAHGIQIGTGEELHIVKNNIVTSCEEGVMFTHAPQFGDIDEHVEEYISFTYNCFWNNETNFYALFGILGEDGWIRAEEFNPRPGTGMIYENPLFVDAENGDFYLTADSPCIDTGDPDSPEDPDGTRADMGAFYYHQYEPGIAVTPESFDFGSVSLWDTASTEIEIHNDGEGPIVISSIEINNEAFRTSFDNPVEEEGQHFEFRETQISHALLIREALMDGEDLPEGNEVGVFTPSGFCAGGCVIDDPGEDFGFAAFGGQQDNEVFVVDDEFEFRYWDRFTSREIFADAEFLEGSETFVNDGFSILDLSGDRETIQAGASMDIEVFFSPHEIGEYEAVMTITSNDPNYGELEVPLYGSCGHRELNVSLIEGWNMMSINVSPTDEFYADDEDRGPDVPLMLAQLRIDEDNHHVILFKDIVGGFYIPSWGYCNIRYWDLTEGYQIKVDESLVASWSGDPIAFDTDIPMTEGWNMIPYFPNYELNASGPDFYVLSPIIDHVIIAKDIQGRFINPEWGYSNMPPWRQTQGYKIKVDEDVTLNYPEQQEERLARNFVPRNDNHLRPQSNTNMSVLINSVSGLESESDLRIQAFNSDGIEVGFGTIDEKGRCGLAVWGDDESTDIVEGLREGEAFELKLVSESSETPLSLQTIMAGNGLVYTTNDFTVLEMSAASAIPEDYFLSQNYPNPFNSITRLNYGLPEAGLVNISVFDIEGRLVETLVRLDQVAGYHYVTWDANIASSGLYFIEMKAEGFTQVQKIVLTK